MKVYKNYRFLKGVFISTHDNTPQPSVVAPINAKHPQNAVKINGDSATKEMTISFVSLNCEIMNSLLNDT